CLHYRRRLHALALEARRLRWLHSPPPLVCFFFQAEDGIRDFHVTGVQTCALPIYGGWVSRAIVSHTQPGDVWQIGPPLGRLSVRSEERRVGKECRSRWSPDH